MKKIIFSLLVAAFAAGLAGVVWAEESSTNANVNAQVTNTKQINTACIQAAIEKKETAVIAALDKKFAALKSALEQRKKALVAAYGLTVRKDRLTARLKAWTDFRKIHLAIKKTYNKDVQAALNALKTELKSCKSADVYGVEQPSMLNDLNL